MISEKKRKGNRKTERKGKEENKKRWKLQKILKCETPLKEDVECSSVTYMSFLAFVLNNSGCS